MNLLKKIYRRVMRNKIREGGTIRAFFGASKGTKWINSKEIPNYWSGVYEKEIANEFLNYAKKSDIIYDFGAHAGFYTIISSKHVKKNGKVYAFEPLPKNFEFLKRHIEINAAQNVIAFDYAISDRGGTVEFSNTANNVANTFKKESSTYQNSKKITVRTISIDELVANGIALPPDLIKMDIEGAEFEGLLGGKMVISEYHPVIFLSTHNCHIKGIHKKCIDFLTKLGYTFTYFDLHKRFTETDDPWYTLLAEYKK